MRTAILGGVFAVGFAAMVWTGAQSDALALGLNTHIANIVTVAITSGVTVLGTAAAFFHINTPSWFKAKTDETETPSNG